MKRPLRHPRCDTGATAILLGLLLAAGLEPAAAAQASSRPNFIVILADDLGWGDLGCYGNTNIATPRLDRMAREGIRFTDFYAAAPFCSPSRAALLTGRLPARCGVPYVLFPAEHHGLPPDEITLAEHLKTRGYATACIGKWHLGWDKPFRPQRHGFDVFFGVPYSNDSREWNIGEPFVQVLGLQPLPLVDGDRVVEAPVDQATLTQRYTRRAVQFIRDHRKRPFFLYLAHTMPHIPQYASAAFAGKSRGGLYGDTIEELDWSTGVLLDTLRELGLAENTLVVFTSDNGPVVRPPKWKSEQGNFPGRNFGGSNGGLRGAKGQTFEGGMRVPCVWWWPGKLTEGRVSSVTASLLDLFPTFAGLARAPLPRDRVYDGRDLGPLLRGKPRATPSPPFFYYFSAQLQAVRLEEWKLFLQITNAPQPAPRSLWYEHQPALAERHHRLWPQATLHNLNSDPAEQHDVAAQNPEVVEKLLALAREFDAGLQHDRRELFVVDGPAPPTPGQIRKPDEDLRAWRETDSK
jgi:arylsulfatase A-like enzyme